MLFGPISGALIRVFITDERLPHAVGASAGGLGWPQSIDSFSCSSGSPVCAAALLRPRLPLRLSPFHFESYFIFRLVPFSERSLIKDVVLGSCQMLSDALSYPDDLIFHTSWRPDQSMMSWT